MIKDSDIREVANSLGYKVKEEKLNDNNYQFDLEIEKRSPIIIRGWTKEAGIKEFNQVTVNSSFYIKRGQGLKDEEFNLEGIIFDMVCEDTQCPELVSMDKFYFGKQNVGTKKELVNTVSAILAASELYKERAMRLVNYSRTGIASIF